MYPHRIINDSPEHFADLRKVPDHVGRTDVESLQALWDMAPALVHREDFASMVAILTEYARECHLPDVLAKLEPLLTAIDARTK